MTKLQAQSLRQNFHGFLSQKLGDYLGDLLRVFMAAFLLIVLIPKIKGAKVIKEYRAISLVTSLYKITMEVLVNIDCGWFYKK